MSVQQADQMPLVYPVSETNPPSNHQSDGSFKAVFIVLAVIVVVSAVACFLGRMCNNHHNKLKQSKHDRPPKVKDMKHKRNVTNDEDTEFERFPSAKVAANGEPNMGRPNSFDEPYMGPHMGRTNSFHEPDMGPHIGRPNSFHELDMGPRIGRPNSFHEPDMGPHIGRPNSFHEADVASHIGRPNSFREPDMAPYIGRPNSFREPYIGPSMGQPNSFKETSLGRPDSFREQSTMRRDSFREPYMVRPNSFRKGELRDDHVRFAGNQDQEMNFKSGTEPPLYQM